MSTDFASQSDFNPSIAVNVSGETRMMSLFQAQQEYDRISALAEPGPEDQGLLAALTISIGTVQWPVTVEWYVRLVKKLADQELQAALRSR